MLIWLLVHHKRLFSYFWGWCPEDQQVLDLFALLQDAAVKQISQQAHICSPEVQGSTSAVCFAAFFKGLELHNVTFPADKAVIDFNQFFVCE